MGRSPCCDKSKVKSGPWSQEEDAMLRSYIELNGTGGNWIALPQKIGLKRCGKSCRLRWLNYLRPNIIHGGFSEAEDRRICELYVSIGSRWSVIAAQLPGRTDNDIKNYWNTKLKKKLLGPKKVESSQSRLALSFNEHIMNSEGMVMNSNAIERMQIQLQLQGLHSFYNSPALRPKSQLDLCRPEYFSNGLISSNYDKSTINECFQEEFSTSSSNLNLAFYDSYNNVDCLQGLNGINVHEEMNLNCYDVSGFYDKSSTSSWDSSSILQGDSRFQEFVFENNDM